MTDINQSQTLTFENIMKDYPPEKFILLMPQTSRTLMHSVPMWSLDVSTVTVDPDNPKHVYPVQGGDLALKAVIYNSIATACDLTIPTERIDNKQNLLFAEFSAVAMMSTPSGGQRGRQKTCDWRGDLDREEIERNASSEADFVKKWHAARKFGARKAETGACNRAIASIMGMDSAYPKHILANKKFAIIRFVLSPDMSHEPTRMAVLNHALAARALYPGAALQPAVVDDTPSRAQLAAAPAEAVVVEDGPPEEVRVKIEEIESILADWPGNEKMLGQTKARFVRAMDNRDIDTIDNLLDYCRDMKLASESGK